MNGPLRLHHHPETTAPERTSLPVIALVGRPNVGKSTFLARATGRFAETANAPGTTVGTEWRRVSVRGREAWLVDLPGTRALDDRPADEAPFWELLLASEPDAIVVVVDASALARQLPLVIACRELGLPIVVAANLADEASARGIEIDAGRLSQLLVAPVVATTARSGEGVQHVLGLAVDLAHQRRRVANGEASPRATAPAPIYPYPIEAAIAAEASAPTAARSLGAAAFADPLDALVERGVVSARGAASIRLAGRLEPERWRVAARWAALVERRRDVQVPLADRLVQHLTAPWPGLPLFLGATVAAFLFVTIVGGWLAGLLSAAWGATVSPALSVAIPILVPVPVVARSLLWSLDGGLLGMLSVGIPYVLTFYVLLAALEDSGYLTSAAVLSDRLFAALGLPGRAAIPLLAAAGCNVPAIYGTRVLRTRRERSLASFLVTLTPCSARTAVVIAALAPFAGPLVALAAFGVIASLAIASGLAANALVPGRQPSFVLELAPLRRPVVGHVMAKAWFRFRAFALTAAPIMLVGSLVLGFIYETGLWSTAAELLAPVSEGWLGLPAVAGIAIVFSVLRKELAVQLLVALAAVGAAGGPIRLDGLMSPPQLFVYAVVAAVSVPCVATIAALRSELGWRTCGAISIGSVALALAVGGILARLLGTA